jgi:hypothetical protein
MINTAGMLEKSIGISSGSQLLQSSISILASGFSPVLSSRSGCHTPSADIGFPSSYKDCLESSSGNVVSMRVLYYSTIEASS